MKCSRCFVVLLGGLLLSAAVGCGCKTQDSGNAPMANSSTGTELPLVVFAQANSQDPWRQVFDADIKSAAQQHASEFHFEMQDAQDDPAKQISLIETYMVKKPKVLLVSAAEASVGAATDKAHDAGIKVILLDRGVPGDKWDAMIGGDNVEIGRQAAKYLVERLNGKGTVLMISGIADASATKERASGAMEVFSKIPGIKVIQGDDCKYQRQAARTFMETFLQRNVPFDAVYAHNDEMAIGAFLAMEAAKVPPKIIVGVDGCQKEIIDYIKSGKIAATFKYPGPGPMGIEVAAKMLKGENPSEKKIVLPTVRVTKENADQYEKDNPNLAK